MKTKKEIWWLLLLAAGMVATVAYASQSQDTRRGAAGSKPQIILAPENKDITLGNTFTVKVMADTKGEKVSAIDLRIKYDKNLLEGLSFKAASSCNGTSKCSKNKQKYLLTNKDDLIINQVDQKNGWVTIAGVSLEGQVNKMPTGIVELGSISFKTIKRGEVKVELDGSYGNKITIFDTSKGDPMGELDGGKAGLYRIKANGNCKTVWRITTSKVCQEEERCGFNRNQQGKVFDKAEDCEKSLK